MSVDHIRDEILRWLSSFSGCASTAHDDNVILGSWGGYFFAIIVKRPSQSLNLTEDAFLNRFIGGGGICFRAQSVTDVEANLIRFGMLSPAYGVRV